MWRRLLTVLAAAGAGAAGVTLWRRATGAGGGWIGARGPVPGGSEARVAGTPRPEGMPASAGSPEARVDEPAPARRASAAPGGSRRCAAITQGGSRCARDAEGGSDYCWQHGS